MSIDIRQATFEALSELNVLIARSARRLGAGYYTPEQIEGALRSAFGVDTQLIKDGTYYVVESGNEIVACGGWSYRQTLFGSDARSDRDPSELDPSIDAAKIRAFFVDPGHARHGLGKLLLEHCEDRARARGFTRFELMSTRPGQPFYAAHGYEAGETVIYPLSDDLTIEFVPMSKGP
ncbi:MAG: GNAT family N-acetyltransferase [Gammaproteobacteria bacterium]